MWQRRVFISQKKKGTRKQSYALCGKDGCLYHNKGARSEVVRLIHVSFLISNFPPFFFYPSHVSKQFVRSEVVWLIFVSLFVSILGDPPFTLRTRDPIFFCLVFFLFQFWVIPLSHLRTRDANFFCLIHKFLDFNFPCKFSPFLPVMCITLRTHAHTSTHTTHTGTHTHTHTHTHAHVHTHPALRRCWLDCRAQFFSSPNPLYGVGPWGVYVHTYR